MSETIKPSHTVLRVLGNPLPVLTESAGKAEVVLQTSASRGHLPIIAPRQERVAESGSAAVIANTGALLMNSPLYYSQRPEDAAVVRDTETAAASSVLGFSKPGDTFVFPSDHPDRDSASLATIARSWEGVGIGVSRNLEPVRSVPEWFGNGHHAAPVVPYIIDPRTIAALNSSGEHLEQVGLANVAAYTKNGAQLLWQMRGVPTPETIYLSARDILAPHGMQHIHEKLGHYPGVVINPTDGSGGWQVSFIARDKIPEHAAQYPDSASLLQVQGRLPAIVSPCLIADIRGTADIQYLLTTSQIFSQPGVHAGNYWSAEAERRFGDLDPAFFETNMRSLEALAQAGVRGQVNVDSLVLNAEDAVHYGVPMTLMREANIRPAGSSILLRLKTGTIQGRPIEQILTHTGIPIAPELVTSGKIQLILEKLAGSGPMRAVLYNYGGEHGKGHIAMAATGDVTIEEMRLFEQRILEAVRS